MLRCAYASSFRYSLCHTLARDDDESTLEALLRDVAWRMSRPLWDDALCSSARERDVR